MNSNDAFLHDRQDRTTSRRARIALYSHDTMGLGHVRRNLLLAQTLQASSLGAVSLLIAGAHEAAAFHMPSGVDCLTLPALAKSDSGQYGSRHMPIDRSDLVTLRGGIIRTALEAFEPDILIVDNVPRGALGELDPALHALRSIGRVRLVLGLRDVLDDAATVRAEWERADNQQTIRDHYDLIWVYGDPLVCDPRTEYGFAPDVAERVRFAGYMDQRARLACAPDADTFFEALRLPPGRLVLGLVGGGQDGARLADAFARAELPPETNALLVTGPFMPADQRRDLLRRAGGETRLRVLEFVPEPAILLARADRVVAMGGYGTTSEILSFERHALIVPRVTPRREQAIRAERLAALGLVHTMDASDVTAESIGRWITRDLGSPPSARATLDFGGLCRVPELLQALLDERIDRPRAVSWRSHHADA